VPRHMNVCQRAAGGKLSDAGGAYSGILVRGGILDVSLGLCDTELLVVSCIL